MAAGLGVMTMRSCTSSPATSPSNPANVATNGVAAVCANRQAVDAAGGPDETLPPVTLPPDLAGSLQKADPGIAAAVAGATNCASPTTTP